MEKSAIIVRVEKSTITVRVPIEGIHHWPGATEFPEVNYLSYPHRHVFNFEVTFAVTHDDRDKEFFILQHAIHDWAFKTYMDWTYKLCDFGPRSCEMLAKEVVEYFGALKCTVYEDTENGGTYAVE